MKSKQVKCNVIEAIMEVHPAFLSCIKGPFVLMGEVGCQKTYKNEKASD